MAPPLASSGPWYRDRQNIKLLVLVGLTGSFMVAEIVFGFVTDSLALISDAFHMLSDVISLCVGIGARIYARRTSDDRMSYGYRRAEVLGGLMNGCFLLSVCLFIALEAIQRFFEPPEIRNPLGIIVVAVLGLAINVAGLFMFHGHGHHGHAHGHGHGHAHDHAEEKRQHEHEHEHEHEHGDREEARQVLVPVLSPSEGDESAAAAAATATHAPVPSLDVEEIVSAAFAPPVAPVSDGEVLSSEAESAAADASMARDAPAASVSATHRAAHRKGNVNLHGVFLHVLGDALGSVGVLVSGVCLLVMPWSFKVYIDPTVSLLIAGIILYSTVPLVRHTARIVLQGVPENVDLAALRAALLALPGVRDVHELHCWLLVDSTSIASVHLTLSREADFMQLAARARAVLHKHHIHSSTIQPEFVDDAPPVRAAWLAAERNGDGGSAGCADDATA